MMLKRGTGGKVFGAGEEKGLSRNPVDWRRVDGGKKNKRSRRKRSNRAAWKSSTISYSPLIHVYRMRIYVSYFYIYKPSSHLAITQYCYCLSDATAE